MTQPILTCHVQGGPVPAYAHPGDAGADLYAAEDALIPARGRTLVATGIRIALPAGHVGLIWPRSGMAVKQGIDCGAGVIDAQYRGEVRVLLFNHSDDDVTVKKGDRIAQLLVQQVARVEFFPVEDLDETARGANGFGSSG
ncbi:dUTP diphosphatase [Nitrospina watsonii]|uniref:dUTP diphosphatase n=1 Tax=Nitrospina watsonii TaxID=1323948 RepID=A0ABM9HGB2_9BACT|nr:dUTP diphosphatase [Nitrospina watsonii]CAI2719073.1 Deoxyuridine 5'-triphosphate nucleotidohydrolase [Nitrospina watsonii]